MSITQHTISAKLEVETWVVYEYVTKDGGKDFISKFTSEPVEDTHYERAMANKDVICFTLGEMHEVQYTSPGGKPIKRQFFVPTSKRCFIGRTQLLSYEDIVKGWGEDSERARVMKDERATHLIFDRHGFTRHYNDAECKQRP